MLEVSGRTYPRRNPLPPADQQRRRRCRSRADRRDCRCGGRIGTLTAKAIFGVPAGRTRNPRSRRSLRKSTLRRNDEILPLFARLSHAEQHKIFHPSGAKRRIVLATNVAETSLTVPGIKYVIDTGLARVKRYSARAKVEQLHVEKSPKPPPANVPAAAAASPQAYVSDCFQKKISTAAPNSPTPKSSAVTSPPSSCVWHH